jgi:hypothetical protein
VGRGIGVAGLVEKFRKAKPPAESLGAPKRRQSVKCKKPGQNATSRKKTRAAAKYLRAPRKLYAENLIKYLP